MSRFTGPALRSGGKVILMFDMVCVVGSVVDVVENIQPGDEFATAFVGGTLPIS